MKKIRKINPKLLELIVTPDYKSVEGEKENNAELFDTICEGERHDKLVKFACALSRQGLSESALIDTLLNLNDTLCENPLPEKEVIQIARSIFGYKNYKNNPDLNNKGVNDKIFRLLYKTKGNAEERYQIISNLIIKDLEINGKFIKTNEDSCYFFNNEDKVLIEINPENMNYKKLLLTKYKINPKLRIYTFLHQAILIHCYNKEEQTNVYKYAHYDIAANKLYVKCGPSKMYLVDTKNICLCDNGDDGVLFSDVVDSEPFDYVVNNTGKDYIIDEVVSLCNFNQSELDVETQKILAKAYFLSIFMPELLVTKPIITIIGTKGSGKTTLLKAFVKILFGKKHNVCSVPNKLDDLDVLVVNSHFLALDNWDLYKAEYGDKIAVYATGGYIQKRKLYTDSEMFKAKIDTFIGISTRALNIRRDDLLQRLILLEVNPVSGGYIAETDLMKPIEDNRNEIMLQALNEIQRIMRIIESKKYKSLRSGFRMADFAKFLTLLLNNQEQAEEHLKKMTQRQKAASVENDILLLYLASFVLLYEENYYSAHEIYKLIVEIDKDKNFPNVKTDFEKQYENVITLARRINNIKDDIKEYLIIETRKGRSNKTEYLLKKGEKFDELDNSVEIKQKISEADCEVTIQINSP